MTVSLFSEPRNFFWNRHFFSRTGTFLEVGEVLGQFEARTGDWGLRTGRGSLRTGQFLQQPGFKRFALYNILPLFEKNLVRKSLTTTGRGVGWRDKRYRSMAVTRFKDEFSLLLLLDVPDGSPLPVRTRVLPIASAAIFHLPRCFDALRLGG